MLNLYAYISWVNYATNVLKKFHRFIWCQTFNVIFIGFMFSEFKSGADQFFFPISNILENLHAHSCYSYENQTNNMLYNYFPFLFSVFALFLYTFPYFFFKFKGGGVQLPWLPTPSESSNTHCFLIIIHRTVLHLACLHFSGKTEFVCKCLSVLCSHL